MAVDGNFSTRWSSDFYDPQTISVDLLSVYTLETVVLAWETAYSSEYKLEVSTDGNDWTTLVHELEGDGGNDTFYPDVDARYIRVEGLQRGHRVGTILFGKFRPLVHWRDQWGSGSLLFSTFSSFRILHRMRCGFRVCRNR